MYCACSSIYTLSSLSVKDNLFLIGHTTGRTPDCIYFLFLAAMTVRKTHQSQSFYSISALSSLSLHHKVITAPPFFPLNHFSFSSSTVKNTLWISLCPPDFLLSSCLLMIFLRLRKLAVTKHQSKAQCVANVLFLCGDTVLLTEFFSLLPFSIHLIYWIKWPSMFKKTTEPLA